MRDLSKVYVDRQRTYYAACYAQSRDIQTAYWATWQKEKEFVSDYYGYNPHHMMEMVDRAFDAFIGFAQEQFEPRIKGITNVIALSNKAVLSPQETLRYSSVGHLGSRNLD